MSEGSTQESNAKIFHKLEGFEGKVFPFRISLQKEKVDIAPLHWHEHLEIIGVMEASQSMALKITHSPRNKHLS